MACNAKYIADLFAYFETDPCVQTCFKRMLNVVMSEECVIKEQGREVQPALRRKLNQHYRLFAFEAMKMAYVTGFVAFYITLVDGIRMPMTLTPGTYSWIVEVIGEKSKKRKFEDNNKCCRYTVQMHSSNVKENDVFIVNFCFPILHTDNMQSFPIKELYRQHMQLHGLYQIQQDANMWNQDKHVCITEQFDLKDQTTSGIELLDEVRRYTLTGQSGITPIVRMRRSQHDPGSDSYLHSVNDANLHWLEDQFRNKGNSKAAKYHLLPANMSLTELGEINVGQELQTLLEQYRTSVHDFFDMPNTQQTMKTNTETGNQLSRQQYNNVLAVNQFLQHTLEVAYKVQFKLPPDSKVEITLQPQTRLNIDSIADIKALCEVEGLLSEHEKKKIKSLFLKG